MKHRHRRNAKGARGNSPACHMDMELTLETFGEQSQGNVRCAVASERMMSAPRGRRHVQVADELEHMLQRLDRMHDVYTSCRATPHLTHVYEALEATTDPLRPAPRQLMSCDSDATARSRAASGRRAVAWAPGVRGDEIKLSHSAISTAQVPSPLAACEPCGCAAHPQLPLRLVCRGSGPTSAWEGRNGTCISDMIERG